MPVKASRRSAGPYLPPEATPAVSVRSVALASLIGTTIEWYDFFLYGTASALVFNRLYLPHVRSAHGNARRVRDVCGWIRRATDRRHRHRTLRRQDRAEIDARAHARPHGRGDVLHRTLADVRADRPVGSRPPRDPSIHSRIRSGWRVGRCGADGRRARATRQTRILRELASDGRADRAHPVDGGVRAIRQAPRSAVPGVGMAHPILAEHRAGRCWTDRPAAAGRVAGLHEGEADWGRGRAPDFRCAAEPAAIDTPRSRCTTRRKGRVLRLFGLPARVRRRKRLGSRVRRF